ncbi:MAG: DUF4139 domain-containing protein [Desulfovibrio desulfuricans]|jgi:uncharacterized protein (TIGR02231 family)|nr:DUF4139 domain-containing protein [Desulfovibrio desulfuricans]
MKHVILAHASQGAHRRTRQARGLRAASFAALALLAAAPVVAAPVPVAPESARLSPSGGLLEVRQQAAVTTRDGVSRLSVALPAGAENFQIIVPGQTVARWNSRPLALEREGAPASARRRLVDEIRRVEGSLAAVDARLELLGTQPAQGTFQDMVQQEKHLAEAVPALAAEKAELEERLPRLREELKHLPPEPGLGTLVEVVLLKPVTAAAVDVRYSYTLGDCGWQPRYVFDARPDEGKGVVAVRFLAEMWQNSGMDWEKTRLILVSGGGGPREPGRLPRWVLEAREPARAMSGKESAAMVMDEAPMMAARASNAEKARPTAQADTSSVYASWTLAARGLPEGRSRMLVLEEMWNAPLQWLARPSRGDSRVWLTAHCTLPAERVWPAGAAEFLMDGQSVGDGRFAPRGDEADLYFGPDPRVQVQATEDERKRGEEGFINKSRTWSWAWTYTVRNTRDKAVTVRLERPMPQVVNKEISVTCADAPEAQKDEREHKLFWDVPVPAGGQAEVRHALTVTAPKDMRLSPVAP